MSISANVNTDSRGNVILHMKGDLDYQYSQPFRSELTKLIGENPNSTITLDMNGIDFVGSSGIGQFVETIKTVDTNSQLRLSGVKTEFLRVFKLYNFDAEKYMTEEELEQAFSKKRQ